MRIHHSPKILIVAIAVLVLGGSVLLATNARARPLPQSIGDQATSLAQMEPANYCLACHAAGDPQIGQPTAWRGGIEREAVSPCPAITRLHEEQYYTERLMLAVDRGLAGIPAKSVTTAMNSRIATTNDTYGRMLDTPVTSLDAFVSEAQTMRYNLGKVYNQIDQISDSTRRGRVLIFAGLVSLVLLVSLGWGIYNTRHVKAGDSRTRRFSYYAFWGVALLLIFGLFTLPLFRTTSVQTASANTEVQTALDTSQRVATAAGRADGRAWMFSKVGAAWNPLDPAQAQQALADALAAAEQSEMNAFALWGEAAGAREISVEEPAMMEKAGLIADQLNAARSRAWSLGLIGEEWTAVDPARSEEIYESAYQTALKGQGVYRDLDLRRVAVAWSATNPQRAAQVAQEITDPALRAWGLREIAVKTGDDSLGTALFAGAHASAAQIADPFQRARALSKIAAASQDSALFDDAAQALEGQSGAALAYALGELAADSGNAALVEQIDPAYPDARALALLQLGQYQTAWEAAQQITDPYEQGRAQAAIVSAWAKTDGSQAAAAAGQIQVPVLRERATRDVIRATGDASLVQKLNIAYYQVQALTALGQFQNAWASSSALKDPYPLVALGVSWAQTDPQAAEQVLDQLSREVDKAVVLQALAVATDDSEMFDRALGMALAARVRNDALAPAQASLDLAAAFYTSAPDRAEAALKQAYEITQRISIK